MTNGRQKLKFALFLLISAAVAVALVLVFAGRSLFQGTTRYYVHVPDSVDGLEQGSPVKVQGVRVGSVEGFELNPDGRAGVRVALEVQQGTPIARDARAFMKFKGVTGLRIIDIEQGSLATGRLRPGETIPYGETTLDKLSERVDELIEKSLALADSTEKLAARALVVAEEFDIESLNRVVRRADAAFGRLEGAGAELEALLAETRRPMRTLLLDTRQTLLQANLLLESGDSAIGRLDTAALHVASLLRTSEDELRVTFHNLRDASESFKDLGRELRQNPSSLLFSRPPPERELP